MEHSFAVREGTLDQAAQQHDYEVLAMSILSKAAALTTAAAIAVSAVSVASAAPIGSGQLAVKEAASIDDVTNVHWRGRWRWGGVGLGVLGGIALGSALAYGPRYYGPAYAYGPAYPYPSQRCWIQTGPYRGQGYWGYC